MTIDEFIEKAIRLSKENKSQECRELLRQFLLHKDALLWLAKNASTPEEAVLAADLAIKLAPESEKAQRAVIAVRSSVGVRREEQAEKEQLLAAVVLLTGMTLTQARAVKWSFQGIQRPIGDVLDDETIKLRDLVWAYENAFDERIKNACKTILLARMLDAEPKEPRPPLRVISGSRYTEWQERKAFINSGILSGIALTLCAVALVAVIGSLFMPQFRYDPRFVVWFRSWFSFFLFLALASAFLFAYLTNRFFDEADQYKLGRHGEENVADELRANLDGRWTLFRNFEFPNRRAGDVDLILVGPGGVFALEVKAYSRHTRNIGDRWERKGRLGKWFAMSHRRSPQRQSRKNARALYDFLNGHGAKVKYVDPIIVWAGDENKLTVEDPATTVWFVDKISDNVEGLWSGSSPLTDETLEKVLTALREATEKSKKA